MLVIVGKSQQLATLMQDYCFGEQTIRTGLPKHEVLRGDMSLVMTW